MSDIPAQTLTAPARRPLGAGWAGPRSNRPDAPMTFPFHTFLRISAAVAAIVASLAAAASPAEAGKARDYLNAPVNTWVTFYNFGHTESVSPVVGGAEFGITGVETDITSQSIILSRIIDVAGRTGGLSVILPWADINTSADRFRTDASGFGDLGLVAEVNLFGAPALSKEEFAAWTPETFASLHVVLSLPTGSYDPDDRINVGSNRLSLTPTVNYSYTPDAGRTWLETYPSVTLFGDNEDAPGGTLDRDPLFQIEGHASHNLTDKFWASADLYYALGGETQLGRMPQDDDANTLRLGVGMGVRVPYVGTLMLNYERVVAKPAGQPEGQSFRLTIARVW